MGIDRFSCSTAHLHGDVGNYRLSHSFVVAVRFILMSQLGDLDVQCILGSGLHEMHDNDVVKILSATESESPGRIINPFLRAL